MDSKQRKFLSTFFKNVIISINKGDFTLFHRYPQLYLGDKKVEKYGGKLSWWKMLITIFNITEINIVENYKTTSK